MSQRGGSGASGGDEDGVSMVSRDIAGAGALRVGKEKAGNGRVEMPSVIVDGLVAWVVIICVQ